MAKPTVQESSADMRLDAAGAFAHDLRTPLTSITMVLDIARSIEPEGDLSLDAELENMLRDSVASINELVDDFQESSRIERAMVAFATVPTNINDAIDIAMESAGCVVSAGERNPEDVIGPWDEPRLARALAQMIDATNRLGDGGGTVSLASRSEPQQIVIELGSGSMDGEERAISTDAGYFYFHGLFVIEAMGGAVTAERVAGGARITVVLPRA